MSGGVLVLIEQFDGNPLPASWEVLALARTLAEPLGGSVCAAVFGHNLGDIVPVAFHYGADLVYKADDHDGSRTPTTRENQRHC